MKVGRGKVKSDGLSKWGTCDGDIFLLYGLWRYEDFLRDSDHMPKLIAYNKRELTASWRSYFECPRKVRMSALRNARPCCQPLWYALIIPMLLHLLSVFGCTLSSSAASWSAKSSLSSLSVVLSGWKSGFLCSGSASICSCISSPAFPPILITF